MEAILDALATDGSRSVTELARALGVSTATVRRDLRLLADQRLLARTHGGAMVDALSYELPLRYRASRQSEAKRRIAAAAAELVAPGAVVGISGGTTTGEVARLLGGRAGLTVVTNALDIAVRLAVRRDITLIVTGGMARSASYELVGPAADRAIRSYNLDVAVLGVDGIDLRAGCTTHDPVEAATNAALVEQAARVVVVADHTKVGRAALARICALADVDQLVTDADGPADLAALRAAGLEVTVV